VKCETYTKIRVIIYDSKSMNDRGQVPSGFTGDTRCLLNSFKTKDNRCNKHCDYQLLHSLHSHEAGLQMIIGN
jgi:hypothetical protein